MARETPVRQTTCSQHPLRERTSLGAIIFGILGAPCAISTLIGPLAIAFGASGLFGLTAALVFLDQSAIRVPILILATLAAIANLYTLWHARKLRMEAKVGPHLATMTTLEKRRTLFVLAASLATLAIVAFEIVAHTCCIERETLPSRLNIVFSGAANERPCISGEGKSCRQEASRA